jgi:serine/threonine protein kinase
MCRAQLMRGSCAVRATGHQLMRPVACRSRAARSVFRGLLWGQRVAVKRLMTDRDGADAESLRRELLHETRLLARLSHPCITLLIGYTPSPAQLVLEVLDGTVYDLAKAMYNESAPPSKLLDSLVDLLAGCAYLHAREPPLLHRDLKPPNILHDAKGRCKLCDFGTAIELLPGAPLPTKWVGSQLYVAPEVDREEPYGLPADVFSFGVLAYELYHVLETGNDFYGEGMDLFDEGGLMEGMSVVREPLLAEPQEMPSRPATCDVDSVWELLCVCMKASARDRPTFAQVAVRISEAQQAAAGNAAWL